MKKTTIKIGDREISRIGLGAFLLSDDGRPDEDASIRLIHLALDNGVELIDTADSYHLAGEAPGHGEVLIRKALSQRTGGAGHALIATKGGRVFGKDGERYCAGRPEQIKEACEASLIRLGVEQIDLYYFHRPDPAVPYADSLGALLELGDEGKIRFTGVSNVDPDQILLASATLGPRLAAIQNQYSPWFRSSESELELANRIGVTFVPWSPFGGPQNHGQLGSSPVLGALAAKYSATPHQLILRWLLQKSPNILAIPGVRREQTLRSSLGAADLDLEPEDFGAIENLRLEPSNA
jgi:aryl-alcohol dehydrogenase-like predicted oxidoreductase